MIQTGTFYTAVNNENSTETKRALANIFIYFSQNGVRKLTTKTDTAGKFSFDLALGDYQVTISQGANFSVHSLAGGATFSLTSASKADDFEKWAMTPITINPGDNPLVARLAELAKIANDAVVEAKAIADQMNNNSVGNESGKFMKEGAHGIGGKAVLSGVDLFSYTLWETLNQGTSFFHVTSSTTQNRPGNMSGLMQINKITANGWGSALYCADNGNYYICSFNPTRFKNGTLSWRSVLTDTNTTIDSNGFIKAASPVLRLFNDRIETNDQFVEEPIFEKIGSGKYKISSTLGLAQEGWTYEKPRGSDGQPYFRIKVEKLDDGCIISVHDEYIDYEDVEIIDEKGKARTVKEKVTVLSAPRDIKDHERWIDLRFHEEPQEHHEEELLAEY